MKPFQFEGKEVTLNLTHKNILSDLTKAPPFDPKLIDPSHPFYMLVKQKGQMEAYLNKVVELLKGLPKGLDVFEFCGGMGIIAEAMWDLINPHSWTGIDLDQACIDVNICHRLDYNIVYGDMYEPDWFIHWVYPPDNTLVYMDWPTMTLRKMWNEPKVSQFMEHLAGQDGLRPQYIGITDIECGWIHLPNHCPHYMRLFDIYLDIDERPSTTGLRNGYTAIYEGYMRERFKYQLINRTVGGGGEYFLFERML